MTTNHDDCPICAMLADDDDLGLVVEVCETRISYDASGRGNWKLATADTCPANVQREIECEMVDGGCESGEYMASNGIRYRW